MSSQTTSSTPKKPAKGAESRNQAVLPIFVGYALVPLLFAWEILARRLIYLQKIYLLSLNAKGVTRRELADVDLARFGTIIGAIITRA